MRYTRFITFFLFAAVAAVGLSACDFSEQNIDIEPGDELEVRGPDEVAAPAGEASFYVIPFTIEKEYSWSVEGPVDVTSSTRRDGEFLDVTFDEPGDYTVSVSSTVDGEEYSGSITVAAAYPELPDQVGRFGFSSLAAALDAAELTDTLGTDGPFTVLAPTDEAFVAAFDTTEDGALNLPSAAVLADVLQYHVLPTSLSSQDIVNGQTETTLLEGADVTFNVNGDITVTDGSPETNDATVTDADTPASNGLFHSIDAVLLPSIASIDFPDQESADGETVSVTSVYLPEGGFVVVHDSTDYADAGNFAEEAASIAGESDYLAPGFHNAVEITLDDPVADGTVLTAVTYQDTNDNETFDYVTSVGTADGPYERNGEPVADHGTVTVPE